MVLLSNNRKKRVKREWNTQNKDLLPVGNSKYMVNVIKLDKKKNRKMKKKNKKNFIKKKKKYSEEICLKTRKQFN